MDVFGNRLDLFDRVTWWDDLMHFVNDLSLRGLGTLLAGIAVWLVRTTSR